jgi:hypothetical protein
MSAADSITYVVETGILVFIIHGCRSVWHWIRGRG